MRANLELTSEVRPFKKKKPRLIGSTSVLGKMETEVVSLGLWGYLMKRISW